MSKLSSAESDQRRRRRLEAERCFGEVPELAPRGVAPDLHLAGAGRPKFLEAFRMNQLGRSLSRFGAILLVAGCSASGASAPPDVTSGAGGSAGGFSLGGGASGGALSGGATGGDMGFMLSTGGSGPGAPDAAAPSLEPPVSIDECLPTNAAGLDATAVGALQQGGGGPGGLRILNPYDGTVFPRGLIAPLLMWDSGSDGGGATADVVYVHIKSKTFEYKGCLKPTGPNQLQLPQSVWDKAGEHTHGPAYPFTLELTVRSGGAVKGPATEAVVIANANLKGTIYYNSYASKLASTLFGSVGAVLRMTPGKRAELFLGQEGCTACHAVSANGARLVVTQEIPINGDWLNMKGGATFALTPGMPPNPAPLAPTAVATSFTAVSPDGSVYLSTGHAGGLGPRAGFQGLGALLTAGGARLYETDTGKEIQNTGVPTDAMTPMFSPDGSMLVFNDYAIDGGHGLATMSYDKVGRKASNYKAFYKLTDQSTYPAWPLFLPDDKGVVFTIGDQKDFSGANLGINGDTTHLAMSDLYVADVASGTAKILAKAMGFASEQDATAGTTYLPFGASELHHSFYPTGSPVAAGGYFWIFFDSYRHYGNTHSNGPVRQLWGAAIDISKDGTYSADPSHPAFYLTGQEDVEGNHRAFTALDACHKDGDACVTGIDCCGGFCTKGVCAQPPVTGPICANTDESCASGAPCCNAKDRCINGFCGQILQ
jgi:hypothetical protein